MNYTWQYITSHINNIFRLTTCIQQCRKVKKKRFKKRTDSAFIATLYIKISLGGNEGQPENPADTNYVHKTSIKLINC